MEATDPLTEAMCILASLAVCGGNWALSVYSLGASNTTEALTCQHTLDLQPRWSLAQALTCFENLDCTNVQPQGLPAGVVEVAGTRTAFSTTVSCGQGYIPVKDYLGCWLDNEARRLPIQLSSNDGSLSIESCRARAAARGLAFFGLQNGNECYGGGCGQDGLRAAKSRAVRAVHIPPAYGSPSTSAHVGLLGQCPCCACCAFSGACWPSNLACIMEHKSSFSCRQRLQCCWLGAAA